MDFITQNMQVIVMAIGALVLLLIAMAVWRSLSPRISARRGQRLGISEYYDIDKTRRLVLVRRDNVEHLLLIGSAQDLVIETGITPSSIASAYAPQPAATVEAPVIRPAPRAPVFGERKTQPLRPAEPVLRTGETPPRRDEPEL